MSLTLPRNPQRRGHPPRTAKAWEKRARQAEVRQDLLLDENDRLVRAIDEAVMSFSFIAQYGDHISALESLRAMRTLLSVL